MEVGVSTACLYPELVEVALMELSKRNVKLVEIFINTDCEMKVNFVKEMKRVIDNHDMKVSSVHPFTCGIEPMMFFTPYERRFIDVLEYYKKYFEVMNILGAEFFVFHGNKEQNPFPNESYFERYAGLRKVGKEFGITVCQENVARCVSGRLSFLREMSEYLGDEVSYVLDTKQAHRTEEDPFEILEVLNKKIAHVHYSDFGAMGDCVPFGEGEFRSIDFFKKLKSQGYTGKIILELYKGSYKDNDALVENYEKLKQAVNAIN